MPLRLLPILALMLGACSGPATAPTPDPEADTSPSDVYGPRPEGWVSARVEEAERRLRADSAGALVWASIEAHGGLRAWLAASTIEFEFDYRPLTAPSRRMHTRNRVDHWSARARQDELLGAPSERASLAWDGTEAWITPNADAFPISARFWALTPYYFVGMPFVAADPGTRYTRLPDAELDGERFEIVKLTYGDGVGDAPDDYYVLYLHAETHRLHALRYVVSYPGFFAPGEHSAEKLMRYTSHIDAGGLRFATRLDTSRWNVDESTAGDVVTEIRVANIALGRRLETRLFRRPSDGTLAPLAAAEE